MDTLIDKVKQLAASILSPSACVVCKRECIPGLLLCSSCRSAITPVVSTRIVLTATQSLVVHAAGVYENPLRKLVLYKRRSSLIGSYALAELIWQKTVLATMPCDYLVPIPLHWTRFLMRGFNQAHEIARILADKKGCDCAQLLTRVKRTRYQAELPITQRGANVRDAFALRAGISSYANKHVILVDDLMTTGNTLRAAARCIQALNPASLAAVVACRTR